LRLAHAKFCSQLLDIDLDIDGSMITFHFKHSKAITFHATAIYGPLGHMPIWAPSCGEVSVQSFLDGLNTRDDLAFHEKPLMIERDWHLQFGSSEG
jgi:hypothetical protein